MYFVKFLDDLYMCSRNFNVLMENVPKLEVCSKYFAVFKKKKTFLGYAKIISLK